MSSEETHPQCTVARTLTADADAGLLVVVDRYLMLTKCWIDINKQTFMVPRG